VTPELLRWLDVLDNGIADFLFGLIMLIAFASGIAGVLFGFLAVRWAIFWLYRLTWNRVIVSVERKALRGH
jgi:hypothetical protein